MQEFWREGRRRKRVLVTDLEEKVEFANCLYERRCAVMCRMGDANLFLDDMSSSGTLNVRPRCYCYCYWYPARSPGVQSTQIS